MERITLQVLLASVAASFAVGFGMAWLIKPEPAPAADMVAAAPAAAVGLPASAGWLGELPSKPAPAAAVPAAHANAGAEELWAMALKPQDQQAPGYDAEDRLRKLAQLDPTARRMLLQRYDADKSARARELLKSILGTVQTPEVIAFSIRLAASMDVAERKYGLEMLQSVAPDAPETRSLVRRILASEQSPEVLVQALGTLQSTMAEPDEAAHIVAQLKVLAQHADPAVRSRSLAQLGQWDKSGQGAEQLALALADRAPEVRQAAVFAIAQNGGRSDSVKAALIGLVNNPQESRDVRGSALQVLERFALTKEEYAGLAAARARIERP